MKVVKLTIDEENELEGIDAVALVEEPAIEVDFQYFSKQYFQSFNDYPKAAIEAAKQGIKRNEALGNKCGTAVGKRRATQLANGENISLDTIKRMRSFLIRQKDNYDLAIRRKDYDACGYISYLLWGGPSALPWAEKKLRQAGLLEASNEEIIRDAMAKIGPRGGIAPTKKAPRSKHPKSTKTTNSEYIIDPKDRQIRFDVDVSTLPDYTDEVSGSLADIKMIEGVPVFQDENDALKVAEMIGCGLNVHQHEVEGALYYMPCATHEEAQSKLVNEPNKFFNELDDDKQELLLKALDKTGITAESLAEDGWVEMSEDGFNNHLYFAIISDPEKGSLQDTAQYKILYKYSGPKDSKNRTFCRQVLDKDLLFRLEDINNMSLSGENEEFGTYDIFRYKGSYNCRHSWIQKFYRREVNAETAKRSAQTNKSWQDVIGGPRSQEAAQTNPKSRTLTEVEAGVPAGEFQFKAVKGEERVLMGPLMIPDKLIPRIDEEGNKYYVFFDDIGIQKLSYKMITNKLIDSVNIEHDPDRKVDDVSLVETWLSEDPEKDKSSLYGYNLPKGTWFAKYKVNNDSIWEEYVKTGRVKGFSVEGIFDSKTILAHES
jgi:hypothetical protein